VVAKVTNVPIIGAHLVKGQTTDRSDAFQTPPAQRSYLRRGANVHHQRSQQI